MDAEYAVELRGVTKHFRRRTVRGGYTTFKTQLVGLFGQQREKFEQKYLRVLEGVDLLVPKGRTIGIIGENGSGKSTLLKILTGIYGPTEGTVQVRGRVAALLELGAGFHPEFSGRENIFVNGVILGLTKTEIRARLDEIIEFSELGEFIDEPVRTYSSGMYMRLAFAVATFVDPDVLIIDEILAVGDDHFMRKSRAKMEEFKRSDKTIVLVTHDLGTVEAWCDMAAWIDRGRVAAVGEPSRVVGAYRMRVAEKEVEKDNAPRLGGDRASPTMAPAVDSDASGADNQTRWGNRAVVIDSVHLLDAAGNPATVVSGAQPFIIEMRYTTEQVVTDVGFGIAIFRSDSVHVYGTNTFLDGVKVPSPLPATGVIRFAIEALHLNDGDFLIDVAAHAKQGLAYDFHKGRYHFAVRSGGHDVGLIRMKHRWEFDEHAPSALPSLVSIPS